MLKTISEAVFSLVFPVSCELCEAFLPSGGLQGICQNCQKSLSRLTPPCCAGCGRAASKDGERCGHCRNEDFHFDRAYACTYYDDKMKKLLHAFKFERRRFLLPFFANLMKDFADRHLPKDSWDRLVPVPMNSVHERERGFNQARLLSATLAQSSGKAHASGALGCRGTGAMQSSLKRSERKRNAEGRFFVQKPGSIASGRVLLVDDILTTGHTASACAKALKDAGAKTVTVLALARGI